eukprot:CAMPEP_0182419410 /NCGR_PEP_ID=MMETSP1167-20130531/3883_1 /TAXON_ID=2988 /ORGANISM="Mallomonas Sp, Strain CCMP3275" /LENGTH=248 /DNA_ID=CAMNT_0024594335 /DNA_START=148 /DNA_END=894 /DNA_ORIENTATION=+
MEDSIKECSQLKKSIDEGSCILQFGQKADQICNSALEKFSVEAPVPDDNRDNEVLYDKKVEDLERALDAPLHVLYLRQLSLLREKALKSFRTSLTTEGTEFEAMMQADEFFRREAEQSTRQNPDWNYSKEAQSLKASLNDVANKAKKLTELRLTSAKQNQQAMSYLQMQQQQLQAIQQQVQGASSPWNIGVAYRVPDSNINLSGTYQQGRGNIQISCVPDEAIPLLGPNGFVNGVTAGNLGVSFNINV